MLLAVPYAPWSNHVLEFWDRKHEGNILYVTYEDLKKVKFCGQVDIGARDIILRHLKEIFYK